MQNLNKLTPMLNMYTNSNFNMVTKR